MTTSYQVCYILIKCYFYINIINFLETQDQTNVNGHIDNDYMDLGKKNGPETDHHYNKSPHNQK